jgi:hypothetical protein
LDEQVPLFVGRPCGRECGAIRRLLLVCKLQWFHAGVLLFNDDSNTPRDYVSSGIVAKVS